MLLNKDKTKDQLIHSNKCLVDEILAHEDYVRNVSHILKDVYTKYDQLQNTNEDLRIQLCEEKQVGLLEVIQANKSCEKEMDQKQRRYVNFFNKIENEKEDLNKEKQALNDEIMKLELEKAKVHKELLEIKNSINTIKMGFETTI